MFGRPILMTGMLGAAVAAPIAMTEGPNYLSAMQQSGRPAPPPPATDFAPPQLASPEGPGALIYKSPVPIEGAGFVSLAEMLRLDVSKEWVYARWARKSTGLADPELFGVRVPVVTGTAMTDLAGSLTYYFNPAGRVDRLRFHGRTADTTAIVDVARRYFGMQPQVGLPGDQLFQTRSGNNVLCELRTRPEPVLWATSPHESFSVDLEINCPGAGRFVQQRQLTPDLPEPPSPPEPPQPVAQPPAEPAASAPSGDAPLEAASGFSLQDAARPSYRWPN
ncbi:MAG: DUF6690 family protein [Planctomycetota bacterium]